MSEVFVILEIIGYLLMMLFSAIVIICTLTGVIVWASVAIWAFAKRPRHSQQYRCN